MFRRKKPVWDEERLSGLEWPHHPVRLDDDTLSEFITGYPIVAIDFWAPWCAPCKKFSSKVRTLAEQYHGKVAFGMVDIEKNQRSAKENHIMSIPALMLYINGKRVDGCRGNVKWSLVERMLEKHLKDG